MTGPELAERIRRRMNLVLVIAKASLGRGGFAVGWFVAELDDDGGVREGARIELGVSPPMAPDDLQRLFGKVGTAVTGAVFRRPEDAGQGKE